MTLVIFIRANLCPGSQFFLAQYKVLVDVWRLNILGTILRAFMFKESRRCPSRLSPLPVWPPPRSCCQMTQAYREGDARRTVDTKLWWFSNFKLIKDKDDDTKNEVQVWTTLLPIAKSGKPNTRSQDRQTVLDLGREVWGQFREWHVVEILYSDEYWLPLRNIFHIYTEQSTENV